MNKMNAAKRVNNRRGQMIFTVLLAVLLIILPGSFAFKISASQVGSNDIINPDLIYRNLEIDHGLLSVGVYDTDGEQFLYGENLDLALQIPGISRLFLAGIAADTLDPDQRVAISSNAVAADRSITAAPADEIKL